MATAVAFVLGSFITVSAFAGWRLLSTTTRVVSPESDAMRAAVHAATSTLPHLRTGLTRESAARSIAHLHALSQAAAVAIAGETEILATAGPTGVELRVGDPLPEWLRFDNARRLHVAPRLREHVDGLPFGSAVIASLLVRDQRVGAFVALYDNDERLRPEDTRVVSETAALVAAQLELAELEAQEQRLARAELLALRAQISPHFIYNALAAVAGLVRTRPDEARELIAEFAAFIRYAFRGERPYVTLADELHYVEKYLRLEQARFGPRLQVRVSVAPEVLAAVVPALSVQPLVEKPSGTLSKRDKKAAGWRSPAPISTPMSSSAFGTTGRGWRPRRRGVRSRGEAAASASSTSTRGFRPLLVPATACNWSRGEMRARPCG